ncbi:MAG: acetyl-CoA carboxylase biotin carboxylase subunit [Paracoccaceae bacterium]|nr:MAG: acetyl-CoA carboxylase biotin carboxylase subunit [Alphaproteobacteria bacterium]
MFKKILIANRGEIALRVIRTCKEMGIKTVAVYSQADVNAMHVRMADESVCIGPAESTKSYLSIPSIISACEITGSEAVHPGYGFLSENAKFAEILGDHEIKFIGPSVSHINTMGDKINAKNKMVEFGVPCVPGSNGAVNNIEDARITAREIGFPVLLKAAAGGGGIGMKIVFDDPQLETLFFQAKSEAKKSFNDDTIYIEKYLEKPRHIEIQVFGDGKGGGVYLGERDCSIQRRHQKVLEETPSPGVSAEEIKEIGEISANAISKMKYEGAGTIEFLYEDKNFFFIEMNTRLQVEHPITEAVFGIDLVKEQICVASGEGMSFSQESLEPKGHAIECRINAERLPTFSPSPGNIKEFHSPGGIGIRMDSAIYNGFTVPPHYDSLIGKLIVHADDRQMAVRRLARALDELIIDGVYTTLDLFKEILNEEQFKSGEYNIHWLENWLTDQAQ